MKRWLVSGGIAVSVVVAFASAVVVGMILGAGGIAVGGTGGATSPAPRGAPSPWAAAASPSPSASASPAAEVEPVALFVGDSYTVGQGASSPEARWSTLVAEEMGWQELNVADGGTGFVTRRPELERLNYPEQLKSVKRNSVDVVVIAGGQNDFKSLRKNPTAVFDGVANTYALAARRFPDAEIISVGPSTPWVVALEARALDSAVRAAAADNGATYISLLDPNIVEGKLVNKDGIHTTDAGNTQIAERVLATLQADEEQAGARPVDILTSR